MKFKTFINEKNLKKIGIDLDKTAELLVKNCKNNLNWALPYIDLDFENSKLNILKCNKLLRGDSTIFTNKFQFFSMVNTENSNRKLSEGSKIYSLLFSNYLKSWENFPKRTNCIICSTGKDFASGFGHISYVIPFNNTNLAICPKPDMWNCFDSSLKNIKNYFDEQKYIKFFKNNKKFNFLLFDNLQETISHFDQWLREDLKINEKNINEKLNENIDYLLKDSNKGLTLYDIFNKELNPNKNNFKILKSLENERSLNEIWFSGQSIFINEYILYEEKILKQLYEKIDKLL